MRSKSKTERSPKRSRRCDGSWPSPGRPGGCPNPPAEERLQVQERRTEELAETKVQASRRLPLSITGMLLFNAYMNTRFSGAQEFPTVASSNAVPRTAGGTARQTVLGLLVRESDDGTRAPR